MTDLDKTLAKRGAAYGQNWNTYSELKAIIQTGTGKYSPVQQYCLDMILMKISRLADGDNDAVDTWHDIAGYAKLAEDKTKQKTKPMPASFPAMNVNTTDEEARRR